MPDKKRIVRARLTTWRLSFEKSAGEEREIEGCRGEKNLKHGIEKKREKRKKKEDKEDERRRASISQCSEKKRGRVDRLERCAEARKVAKCLSRRSVARAHALLRRFLRVSSVPFRSTGLCSPLSRMLISSEPTWPLRLVRASASLIHRRGVLLLLPPPCASPAENLPSRGENLKFKRKWPSRVVVVVVIADDVVLLRAIPLF